MRSVRAILVLLLLVTLLALPGLSQAAEPQGGMRYTVMVAKFDNQAGWAGQWDIGDAWGAVLTDILHQSGRFIVIAEPDMRAEAMREQDFAASGRTAQGDKAPPIGQMTPAQIIVKGAITHVQDTKDSGGGVVIRGLAVGGRKGLTEINVTMYMVDSATGQILASKSVVGKSKSSGAAIGYYSGSHGWGASHSNFKSSNMGKAIEDAVNQGVQWMIEQLPGVQWKGSVVLLKDGSVYINRGSREGVRPGQVFVVGQAEVIRDPGTGEVLDQSITEVARIQASSVREKISICNVISGDGSSIDKGMAVMLE